MLVRLGIKAVSHATLATRESIHPIFVKENLKFIVDVSFMIP